MKRFLILLLMLAVALPTLAGCSTAPNTSGIVSDGAATEKYGSDNWYDPNDKYDPDDPYGSDDQKPTVGISSIPEGLTGTDVAMLLLAEQRLSTHLINTEDDIFDEGEEVYLNLAQKTKQSINAMRAEASPIRFFSDGEDMNDASDSLLASQTASADTQPLSVYTGEGVTYDQVAEFCRSYEMFAESARIIIENAESGAQMIDFVKKYVRVVDTWVRYPGSNEELYLHVEENSETIYQRSEYAIKICHRYKNEKGQNVYELYIKNRDIDFLTRSVYISGEKYEITRRMEGERYDTLVAENTKGYWEIFTNISDFRWKETGPGMHSPALFVMKEDICYGISYMYESGDGIGIALANETRSSDIINYTSDYDRYIFDLNMGAFDGVQSVTSYDGNLGKILLKNGTELAILEMYRDGALWSSSEGGTPDLMINHLIVADTAWGVESMLMLNLYATSEEEAQGLLKEYLALWGLTPKFASLDKIFAELARADLEAGVIIQHHKWHGSGIIGEEALDQGLAVEMSLFEKMEGMYEAVKDAETVDVSDREAYELLVQFSKISQSLAEGVQVLGREVGFSKLMLTTDETLLLIEGGAYAVFFGFCNLENGELIHYDLEGRTTATYNGGNSFSAELGETSIEIPLLEVGEYTLVAYLATEDGIRISEMIPVTVESVLAEETRIESLIYSATKAEDGSLHIVYEESNDVLIAVQGKEITEFEVFYDLLADAVYPFGMPEETVEMLDGEGNYVAMTGEETAFVSGEYRMTFTVSNGEKSKTGHAYFTYTAIETEEEPEKDPGENLEEKPNEDPSGEVKEEVNEDSKVKP